MKTDSKDLRAYLLGSLPDELADDLDRRLFENDEVHRQLEQERDSLIEDFVEQRLSSEDEALFEAQCHRSPGLLQRVTSLRVLLRLVEQNAVGRSRSGFSFSGRLLMFASPLLIAALLTVAFLYTRGAQKSRDRISQLQSTKQARQLPVPAAKAPAMVVFLSAVNPRGKADVSSFKLPSAAQPIEFQVEVHAPTKGSDGFHVEVLRGAETVWQSENVPLRHIGQESFLSVVIDSRDLHAGSYLFWYAPLSDPLKPETRAFGALSGR